MTSYPQQNEYLQVCIFNSLMEVIMRPKFQINKVIITLFSGMWAKKPPSVAEKSVKCLGSKLKRVSSSSSKSFSRFFLSLCLFV